MAAFDTLATARKLKAAGIAEAHAEAIAECAAASAHAARSELASKADIASLKTDIAGLEAWFYRAILWQCAFTVAVAAGAVSLMQALG